MKTQRTDLDVAAFIGTVKDPTQRSDCFALVEMMRRVSGSEPAMWGPAIIGFGSSSYQSGGKEVPWFQVGFSPRKANLALYLIGADPDRAALLQRLGKHSTGQSCLYIKRLEDVDPTVLETMVTRAFRGASV